MYVGMKDFLGKLTHEINEFVKNNTTNEFLKQAIYNLTKLEDLHYSEMSIMLLKKLKCISNQELKELVKCIAIHRIQALGAANNPVHEDELLQEVQDVIKKAFPKNRQSPVGLAEKFAWIIEGCSTTNNLAYNTFAYSILQKKTQQNDSHFAIDVYKSFLTQPKICLELYETILAKLTSEKIVRPTDKTDPMLFGWYAKI